LRMMVSLDAQMSCLMTGLGGYGGDV